jgi:hypothetical protein
MTFTSFSAGQPVYAAFFCSSATLRELHFLKKEKAGKPYCLPAYFSSLIP